MLVLSQCSRVPSSCPVWGSWDQTPVPPAPTGVVSHQPWDATMLWANPLGANPRAGVSWVGVPGTAPLHGVSLPPCIHGDNAPPMQVLPGLPTKGGTQTLGPPLPLIAPCP